MPRHQNNNSERSGSDSDVDENRRNHRNYRPNPHSIGRPWRLGNNRQDINRNSRQAWIQSRRMAIRVTTTIPPPRPQIHTFTLDPMHYINDKFPQVQVLRRYELFYRQYENGAFRSIIEEEEGYIFNHKDQKIIMADFVKYNWQDVVIMDLTNCNVSTQDWRDLSDYALLFKKLKVLTLPQNKIEYVKIRQIIKFPKLRVINFGKNSSNENPLNQESTRQLIQYREENNNPIILFNREKYNNND